MGNLTLDSQTIWLEARAPREEKAKCNATHHGAPTVELAIQRYCQWQQSAAETASSQNWKNSHRLDQQVFKSLSLSLIHDGIKD
ncbi:MAG: hypothetical protein VKI42_07780 [Synechococcaceae cyanobacterium]|nr:hypothetical protein [Synechococcaceae cyanobacterium]